MYTFHPASSIPSDNDVPVFGTFEIYSISARGGGLVRQDKSKHAKITSAASGIVLIGPWTMEWTRVERGGRLIVMRAIIEMPNIVGRAMAVL